MEAKLKSARQFVNSQLFFLRKKDKNGNVMGMQLLGTRDRSDYLVSLKLFTHSLPSAH